MASIISGFEYDIFISYRQKDNKGDRWVTGFVTALKTELEATFKEDISIYFDENPHDGLLETHHVDKSLEGKLKCLIFIPIISQTYCDQKSFAWQQEFCAFNSLSKKDQFGRDIKLGNGNVASRILPVRIHSLDAVDQKALETEIGTVLRAMEFIYREPGVNRPLSPDDDPSENLNRTKYRNQVNKVANAVKEIMEGLKNFDNPEFFSPSKEKPFEETKSSLGKSIVVLPFEDMSPEKDQEYFCDGLAEEIINSLTKVKDLHVAARTSAFSFKGKGIDAQKIGKKLGVVTLLEGSVRKVGNQLRITAQLINVEDGYHLWSERYDRQLDDVFAIQDEISMQIVNALKIKLDRGVKEIMVKRHTEDFDAYNLYMKGRYFRNKLTEEGLLKGIECFQQAIEKDPRYAKAYGGIADCFFFLGWYYFLPSKDAFSKAKLAAQKALKIDENLSKAHTTLGLVNMMYDRDWSGANKEFVRATELNPGDANAGNFYSVYLSATGRHNESIAEAKRAQRIDPVTPFTTLILATRFYYARQFDPAIKEIKNILGMDPNFSMGYYYLAWPHALKGMLSEALTNVTKAMEGLGKTTPLLSCLGIVYALLRKENEANSVLDELLALSKKRIISSYLVAAIHTGLDQKNQAFEWLETGYEEHDPMMIYLNVDPLLDSIRSDPRFKTLLKKVGLATDEPDNQLFSNALTNPHEKSIVVLPFENNSPDKDDEYFSDGLTEEIITDLSKIHSLRVISRSSAMRLKGTSKDVKTLGRELNVRYVLEGSVRKAKDNLRITVELVDTETDVQLWAEKYSGSLEDVFDIQEKVSRAIADALKLKLTPEENRRIAERPIENLQAYECYLRARQEMYRGTKETMDRTFQLIQNGLAHVGPNELLYASLGYANYWYFRFVDKVHESYLAKAEECAKKVFELNPNSAHGHVIRGLIHLTRGNLQELARSMKRALGIDPSNAEALVGLASSYGWSGKIEAATSVVTKLLEIDPLTAYNHAYRFGVNLLDGRFEEGLGFMEKAYRMDPNSPVLLWQLASAYAWCGRYEAAFPLIDRLADIAPDWPITRQTLFLKYALQGDKRRALQYATEELEIEAQHDHHFAIHLAECYALIDEKEKALDFMEHSIKGFFPPLFLLNDRLRTFAARSGSRR